MKGDFSRDTFNSLHHFSRVMMQQGRVQLDADWNEQVSVLLHYLRTLAKDIIGPYGGSGFGISWDDTNTDLKIGAGTYYVDGILCENEGEFVNKSGQTKETSYKQQPDYEPGELSTGYPLLVYLDVWEQHVTHLETTVAPFTLNTPNIREVALGGPDTATRARVVWQVKVEPSIDPRPSGKDWKTFVSEEWTQWIEEKWQAENRGLLQVRAKIQASQNTGPCLTPPDARYRGNENQLYRVEIHTGSNKDGTPTFKWSRDNGSVCFAVRQLAGNTVTLEQPGRDSYFSLKKNDWVELIDDSIVSRGEAGQLAQVVNDVDESVSDNPIVTLQPAIGETLKQYDDKDYTTKHVLLRRWDYPASPDKSDSTPADETVASLAADGALTIVGGKWITLEDGVQICFQRLASSGKPHTYRTGDYWLIPARTFTGDVEWPQNGDNPLFLPPHGIHHHYAPLAIVEGASNIDTTVRHGWTQLAK